MPEGAASATRHRADAHPSTRGGDPKDLALSFRSILFGASDAPTDVDDRPEPSCFGDLNLDQVVEAVVAARPEHALTGYFRTPLTEVDTVVYRHEVFRDLERDGVLATVLAFAEDMEGVRGRLVKASRRYQRHEKARWFLDAAGAYAEAVGRLVADLEDAHPDSRGLRGLLAYATGYAVSERFVGMREEAARVRSALDEIRYDVWLHGAHVTVGPYDDEADYSLEVARTFARFQQHPLEATATHDWSGGDLDPVEARILDQVAKVFPGPFAALDRFRREHAEFRDPVMTTFDREVQFYLAYLDHIRPLRVAGLRFDFPRVSVEDKEENAADTFDIALAARLVGERRPVVTNSLRLSGPERILVITGPNNGGKTTTARTVGQLHYLAALGCPVPGRHARLYLCDAIYTHFERREDPAMLAGKLQEELQRFAEDFRRATTRSLVIMNEMFSSTTVDDALFLSRAMLRRVSDLDALGVCVTFLDELSTIDEKAVSMVSAVDPDDPATRTYRVERRPADGKAYARAVAEKYGLTYERVSERVAGSGRVTEGVTA